MLMAVGAAVLISQGILVTIFIVDFTKICFLIYALFFGFLIRGGVLAYKLSKK
jgi:hypothetical protein